jgi:GT2 family glycosyltransferase
VFAWCGGSVLLRSSYLQQVGLFDERFFLYYEDTDLSWRGRLLGWRYRYVPASVLRHEHAASSGEGSDLFRYFVEPNRLLMLLKDAPECVAARAALIEARSP